MCAAKHFSAVSYLGRLFDGTEHTGESLVSIVCEQHHGKPSETSSIETGLSASEDSGHGRDSIRPDGSSAPSVPNEHDSIVIRTAAEAHDGGAKATCTPQMVR